MGKNLIEMTGVEKGYGEEVLVLKDIDQTVGRGEWIAIIGPSGSGKTTLLNLICALDRPTSGKIYVDGVEVTSLNQQEAVRVRRETIGLVFQQYYLIPYLDAVENVMLAQYFHSMADETEAIEALKRVGLKDRLNHIPAHLSGGEQQRVCIARAIINAPKILLADEPTGNLDKKNEEIVMDIFKQLHREGHTIVLVTHDPLVGNMAERQIWLDHGRIVRESDRTSRSRSPDAVEGSLLRNTV